MKSFLVSLGCALGLALISGAAQAQDSGGKLPPPPADPRNFEGVWNPHMAPPTGKPGADVSPGTGRDAKGAGTAVAEGSTLECTPIQRLSGAGGGMSNLWIMGPDEIIMISEEDQDVRKFYLRARHPAKIIPQPNGNSIAHWEGDHLVVDTIGFSKPDGGDMGEHTVENFHRDGTSLIDDVTITLNGKTTNTTYRADWRPDLRVWENVCEEGYQRYELVNGDVDSPDKAPAEGK